MPVIPCSGSAYIGLAKGMEWPPEVLEKVLDLAKASIRPGLKKRVWAGVHARIQGTAEVSPSNMDGAGLPEERAESWCPWCGEFARVHNMRSCMECHVFGDPEATRLLNMLFQASKGGSRSVAKGALPTEGMHPAAKVVSDYFTSNMIFVALYSNLAEQEFYSDM